jgi:hypothetical protein
MDKRSFQNETAFQVVMHLARRMLAEKLITGKEYRDFVQEMILPLSAVFRGLIHLIIVSNRVIYSVERS